MEAMERSELLSHFPEGTVHNQADSPAHSFSVGTEILERYQKETGEVNDLEQCIWHLQHCLDATPQNDPNLPKRSYTLAVALRNRFRRTGHIEDLEQCLARFQQSVDTMSEGDPARCEALQGLGCAYLDRYERFGQMNDLDQVISYTKQALETGPDDNEDRPGQLYNIASAIRGKFHLTGDYDYLEDSIRYHQQAMDECTEDYPDRAKLLGGLASALADRFNGSDEMSDLTAAIDLIKQSLGATPPNHPSKPGRLQSCGTFFAALYSRKASSDALEQAKQYYEQALELTPPGSLDRHQRLHNYATVHLYEYEKTGQLAILDKAIQYSQEALEATPANHLDLPMQLHSLGGQIEYRFRRTGELADLDQALHYYRLALETSQDGHPRKIGQLTSMSGGLVERYKRTHQIEDIEQSISYGQQALEAMPSNHPRRPQLLGNLGVAHRARSLRISNMKDLDQAIRYYQKAIEATPEDDPGLSSLYRNYAVAMWARYTVSEQIDDLDQSIYLYQRALDLGPEDHWSKAQYLLGYGFAVSERWERLGEDSDGDKSVEIYHQALTSAASGPYHRITAGKELADIFIDAESWSKCVKTFDYIFRLLPELTPPTNSRADLQHFLQMLPGLASTAASAYLKAGKDPYEALQVLEQGRGIVAGLMIDLKSDVSMLEKSHPHLWSLYTQCQEDITRMNLADHSSLSADPQFDYVSWSNQRQQLFRDLEDLRCQIRECPGFERFLLPYTERELREAASDGPIVYFNVSVISSEAFLITPESVKVLYLENLLEEDIKEQVRLFASRGRLPRREAHIEEEDEEECEDEATHDAASLLLTLWNNAVRPVLKELGILDRGNAKANLPRVWWIGGGAMALLPLHAAGDHSPASQENALSHVISSYAPSLKSLQFIRNENTFTIKPELRSEILIVSMPTTQGGYSPLNVAEEVAAIEEHRGPHTTVTNLQHPRKGDVLEKLKACTIAHFACHGSADELEPGNSALIVGNGVEERLTISDLDSVKQNHGSAQIAYLSACSTAEVKALNLADESIHLASTFQLAGFPHTIGTLWGADDAAAVEMARLFYHGLLQEGKSVAHALHDATITLRDQRGIGTEVTKWAPFIHLGC